MFDSDQFLVNDCWFNVGQLYIMEFILMSCVYVKFEGM